MGRKVYDDVLSGKNGVRVIEIDAVGRFDHKALLKNQLMVKVLPFY